MKIQIRIRLTGLLLSVPALLAQVTQPAVATEPVQIVFDSVTLRGKGLGLKEVEVLEPLQAMFHKAGLQVLGPRESIPENGIQIRMTLVVIRDDSGSVAYQISGRSSRGQDRKLTQNKPGQPQKIWVANLTAARNELNEGLNEIQCSLASIAALLHRAVPTVPPGQVTDRPGFQLPPQPAILVSKELHPLTKAPPLVGRDEAGLPFSVANAVAAEKVREGQVRLEVIIGVDGKPLRVCAKEGSVNSYLYFVQAVMSRNFEPVLVEGKPVMARFPYFVEGGGRTFTTTFTTGVNINRRY